MSSNMLNEIKNDCLDKKLQNQSFKSLQVTSPILDLAKTEKIVESLQIKNKLITCYEEDYTRNTTEIMRLWQRN